MPLNISDDCKNLIANILILNPFKRFKLHEIKSHSWFKKLNELPSSESSNEKQMNKKLYHSRSCQSINVNKENSAMKNMNRKSPTFSNVSLPLFTASTTTATTKRINLISKPNRPEICAENRMTTLMNSLNINECELSKSDFNSNPIRNMNSTYQVQPNHTNHVKLNDFMWNSSSLDEGVASDLSSTASSSFSNDYLSSSISSFYSTHLSSLDSTQSSKMSFQMSNSILNGSSSQTNNPMNKIYFINTSFDLYKKNSELPPSMVLNRRYKLSNMKKNINKMNNKNLNPNISQIKRELYCLMKKNNCVSNLSSLSQDEATVQNSPKVSNEHLMVQTPTTPTPAKYEFKRDCESGEGSQAPVTIQVNSPTHQKHKHFVFLKSSKKVSPILTSTHSSGKEIQMTSKSRRSLLRQKSSSLNSLSEQQQQQQQQHQQQQQQQQHHQKQQLNQQKYENDLVNNKQHVSFTVKSDKHSNSFKLRRKYSLKIL